jgi:plastocyanin
MNRTFKVGWLLAAGFLAFSSGVPAATREAKTHTVTIEGMRFEPAALTIRSGDSVVWVNKDMFPHTATSKAGGFDSEQIAASASWRHTFTKKGEFSYVCTLHPTMTAALKVR